MAAKVTAVVGDITVQAVDAIVNAANRWLENGGGVCGAIFEAAGVKQLQGFCDKIKRTTGIQEIPDGQSVVTPGGKLKAKWVIHTVGPRYGQTNGRDAELLASCYRTALALADKKGMKTVAFPSISTGIFGYPPEEAAKVASETIRGELPKLKVVEEVRLVFFRPEDLEVFRKNSVLPV
jgi:O-acetyl-ADP-ribose deacetylase (regulator of RNase III)